MPELSLREHAEAVFAESLERLSDGAGLRGLRDELLSCRARLVQPMRVVVVGLTNAGKSTLLNALLGAQLVPTGPVETTYNVSWMSYGPSPALRLHFKDGRPYEERPFGDYAGLAQHGGGDPERNNVKYVELSLPIPLLKQFDLIDTPGVASDSREDSDQTRSFIGAYGDVLTAATNEEASNADAVLFLFKSALHQTDLSVAQEIQGPAFGRATPINSIGVLTRIDAYWQPPEVPDPLAAGLRVAERNSALPQVRSRFYTIKPVCGLLGLGAQTLTPGELDTLLRLSALSEERLESLVGDESRFADRAYADVEVSPNKRRNVLARLGLYGVWLACGLVRAGCREPELLKGALEEHSGLIQLRELILSHFGNRAFLIKLETVLNRIRARCFAELRRTRGTEREAVSAVADAFSRVRSGEHAFAELDVLRDFYGGKLNFDEAEVRQLLEVTGEFGSSAHARLGVPEGTALDELLLTAGARIAHWQRRANDFKPVNLETVTAARTLARSYEILIDRLVKGEFQTPPSATGDARLHAAWWKDSAQQRKDKNMLSNPEIDATAIETLKHIFHDRPELLDIVTIQDIESERMLENLRLNELFASHINLYVAGKTHAGKTTIGNVMFGSDVMKSTGHMDCTNHIGLIRLKSNLWFFDTPGGGSKEDYENVARAALRLEQIEDNPLESFELRDYTDSAQAGRGEAGIAVSNIGVKDWDSFLQEAQFAPDVIVFVVAPHMLFLRDDASYFRTILRAYPEKVVVALNIFSKNGIRITSPELVEDARARIAKIYEQVTGGSAVPRFVELDAKTGRGLNELTQHVCAVLPPEKLGNMQDELRSELKTFAEKERNRRYENTLTQIAARLAAFEADKKGLDLKRDLISVAAVGIAHYTVMSFKNSGLLAEIHGGLQSLVQEEAERIKEARTELVKETTPVIQERELMRQVPVWDEVEVVETAKQKTSLQLAERMPETFGKRFKAGARAAARKFGTYLTTWDAGERNKTLRRIERDAEKARFKTVLRTKEVEVDVPFTRVEQKIVRYEEEHVATIKEVVGFKEEIKGKITRVGGAPVVEFLIGFGRGVRELCAAGSGDVQSHVERQRELIQLRLGPSRQQIEKLVARGAEAERELVELLNDKLR